MYERHFGLTKPPFRMTPDPEFFFAGGRRGAVLEALVYAVMRGEGITKVVGEVGSGKTMLCRMLERELPPVCEKIYLANPRLAPTDILRAIALELQLPLVPDINRLELMHALQDHLLTRHARNVRVILFVEEAQGMPLETLEELRMLSNLETTQDKLLQIVLFGQPELDDKLGSHDIRQLRERITHSFELRPLATAEVGEYVTSRARASGYRGAALFTPGAVAELARHSRGLLRRVNILADKALLAAFADHATRVERRHVRLAARDSEFGRLSPGSGQARWTWGVVVAALLGGGVLIWALNDGWESLLSRVQGRISEAPSATPDTKLSRLGSTQNLPAEHKLRASDAVSPPAAVVSTGEIDNREPVPEISARTGLAGITHLRPVQHAAPAREALVQPRGRAPEEVPSARR